MRDKKMIFFKKMRTSSVVGVVSVAITVAAIVDADAKDIQMKWGRTERERVRVSLSLREKTEKLVLHV